MVMHQLIAAAEAVAVAPGRRTIRGKSGAQCNSRTVDGRVCSLGHRTDGRTNEERSPKQKAAVDDGDRDDDDDDGLAT